LRIEEMRPSVVVLHPILPLLLTLVAAVCCCGCRTADEVAAEPPAAASNTLARLRNLVFTRSTTTSGNTQAILYKERGYAFMNFEEVNEYVNRSRRQVQGTAHTFELEDDPVESPYWWKARTDSGATELIHLLADAFPPGKNAADTLRVPRAHSVLEKALAQRDLLQTYSLVWWASQRVTDDSTRAVALRLESMIATALGSVLLSEADYGALKALLPKAVPANFTSRQTYSLAQNYLPLRVLATDDSWLEIPHTAEPFRHFTEYGGRSFVRIYVHAPNVSNEELTQVWQRLYDAYGNRLHVHAIKESTPPGMETMLMRTFGVLLRDGTFRDSFWPEEVTLRIFKYPRAQLDPETSDFSGTLFFRYVLSRSALLANPASLGLRRTWDDDIQFFGFIGDVPDRWHALSDTVTTMRSNCIGCHSPVFYGLNTIFSFERNPQPHVAETPTDPARQTDWVNGPPPEQFKSILRLNVTQK
jgi:hypothetical protein